jgi:hypothetical protein
LWSVRVARLASLTAGIDAEGVTITFLANEGVMLSSGGQKVLIDALFLGASNAERANRDVRSALRFTMPVLSPGIEPVYH